MSLEIEAQEFQETILRSIEQHKTPYLVKLKGVDYVLFPETFNPNYGKASLLLLDNLGVKKGDIVLDLFSGCGVDAIFAILEGASKAVAIERFTMPYLCIRYNSYILGLDSEVDARQGDLFDALKQNERFDLIIANPPFKNIEPVSNLEAAFSDKNYATLDRFWRGVGNYLNPNGRIRMVFSNVGNMDYFHKLIRDNGFSSETIAQTRYAADVLIKVYEFKKIFSLD